jgi:hypothetical protein
VQNAIARGAQPTPNTLRREIAALYRAAERREYDLLIQLIEQITPAAQWRIEQRRLVIIDMIAKRPKPLGEQDSQLNWRVPELAEPRDPAQRERAVENFCALIAVGTAWKARKRPSGRPTVNLVPRLAAPRASRAEPRRSAERTLIMWLQLAVAETGAKVALTAHAADASRRVGWFAQMVAKILVKSGLCEQTKADGRAIRAINDLHQAHRKSELAEPRPCHDE